MQRFKLSVFMRKILSSIFIVVILYSFAIVFYSNKTILNYYFSVNKNIVIDKIVQKTTITPELKQQTSIYPNAKTGEQKVVIALNPNEITNNEEIILLVGLIKKSDCNYKSLAGEFEEKTLEKTNYQYFIFTTDGSISTTLMGCPENYTKTEFVYYSIVTRYQGLPIVLYIPINYEVRYQFGHTGKKLTNNIYYE